MHMCNGPRNTILSTDISCTYTQHTHTRMHSHNTHTHTHMHTHTHTHTHAFTQHTRAHAYTHTHSFRMLEADVGRTVFPDYDIIVTKPLFSSAEEFTRYVCLPPCTSASPLILRIYHTQVFHYSCTYTGMYSGRRSGHTLASMYFVTITYRYIA